MYSKVKDFIQRFSWLERSVNFIGAIVGLCIAGGLIFTYCSNTPRECIGDITIRGNDEDGIQCKIPSTGEYAFAYKGGSYSSTKSPTQGDWRTKILVFKEDDVPLSDGRPNEALAILTLLPIKTADFQTQDTAQAAAYLLPPEVFDFEEGQKITLVASDVIGKYGDNLGEIRLSISITGQ